MKIHEKIFTYFESCNSAVDKEGYLYKKGEIKTSYQKRWFVLKGNVLFYKDRASDRDVTGAIVLEGCTVQLCESEEQFAFALVWAEPGLRTYKLAAEDQQSQESWIKALLSANHSYLNLLVMDLEKLYREALGEFSMEATSSVFVTPNFNTAAMGYPAAGPTSRTSTLPLRQPPPVPTSLNPSPGPMLLTPTLPPKSAGKRSPKLWPKRGANAVAPVNGPAPPLGDWLGLCVGTKEEFIKLHEDFGKEVRELISDWSKRGGAAGAAQEENLIDFG